MMTTVDPGRATRSSILAGLSPPVAEAVERIAAVNRPWPTYLVAGVVRDAILGRTFTDVDLVTEGDAIEAVRGALPEAKVTAHEEFRTASVRIAGTTIDVVTARSETYVSAGALPTVRRAAIDDDLRRRDFTVNSMAVRLDADQPLLDPTGGLDDLQRGLLRVHHKRSFEDDPTRIFRALRYAARLDFELEPETRKLLHSGLAHVSTLSGARLRRELELMILEPTAGASLEAAYSAGALAAIDAALRWDGGRTEGLRDATLGTIPRVPLGFGLLACGASSDEASRIVERLRLRRDEAKVVRATSAMRGVARTLRRPGAKPSGVVVLLDRYPSAAVAAFAFACDDRIAALVALRYLAEWRHVKPLMRGNDLLALGVPEGPQIEKGLQLIRAARLDGWASDKDDERALVLRFAKSIRDSRSAHAGIELHINGQ